MSPSTDKTPQPAGPAVRKTPWRRWLVAGGAIVAVFVVAGLIGSLVRANKETQLVPPDGAAGASSLAVPQYGHAAVSLTLYEDMRDPASLAFENTYGATLRQLVGAGVADVYYRETTGVDTAQGGSGSLQAGNALGCAVDTKAFQNYRAVLLNNQPAESDDAFSSKSHLIELAKKVKGLDTDVFRACVDNEDHKVWVQDSTKGFTAANLGPVPVLTMAVAPRAATDGASASPSPSASAAAEQTVISSTQSLTPQQLLSLVLAAAEKATPGKADMPSIAVTNGATATAATSATSEASASPSPSLSPSLTASPKAAASASASGRSQVKASGSASPSATH